VNCARFKGEVSGRTERGALNFCESSNCIRNNHGVAVSEKLMELTKKSSVLNQLWVDIKQLCYAYCGCFSNVRVFVLISRRHIGHQRRQGLLFAEEFTQREFSKSNWKQG
tara:strand:- start:383 stop:712 length:330 start_codon:yes stop_codon:yes gene_type:complete